MWPITHTSTDWTHRKHLFGNFLRMQSQNWRKKIKHTATIHRQLRANRILRCRFLHLLCLLCFFRCCRILTLPHAFGNGRRCCSDGAFDNYRAHSFVASFLRSLASASVLLECPGRSDERCSAAVSCTARVSTSWEAEGLRGRPQSMKASWGVARTSLVCGELCLPLCLWWVVQVKNTCTVATAMMRVKYVLTGVKSVSINSSCCGVACSAATPA